MSAHSRMSAQPWNPIIANVFHRAGIIERWGSGTLNIIDWCEENNNPPPTWREQAGSVYVTFFLAVLPQPQQVTPPVTPQVERLLRALVGEMSRAEMMAALGLKDRMHFATEYLQPALEAELIEMTISDKPRRNKQEYRLTEKGEKLLAQKLLDRKMTWAECHQNCRQNN